MGYYHFIGAVCGFDCHCVIVWRMNIEVYQWCATCGNEAGKGIHISLISRSIQVS